MVALSQLAALALAFAVVGCGAPGAHVPADDVPVKVWRAEAAPMAAAAPSNAVKTLAEAMSAAIARDPEVLARTADVAAARAAARVSEPPRDPQLRVTNLAVDRFIDGNGRAEVALRVHPARPGSLAAREHGRELTAAAAEARLRAARQAAGVSVARLVVDVHLAARRLELARRQETLATAHRALISQRVDAQVADNLELAAAGLQVARSQARVRALEAHQSSLTRKLTRQVGAEVVLPTSEGVPRAPVGSLEELTERALRRRAGPRLAALRISRAESAVAVARAQRWPWLSYVQVGYEARTQDPAPEAFVLALALDLPFFRLSSAHVDASEAAVRSGRKALSAAVSDVAAEVSAAHREVTESRRLVDELRDAATKAQEKALAALAAAQRAGTARPGEAREIWREVLRLGDRHLDAEEQHLRAILELIAAVGDLGGHE